MTTSRTSRAPDPASAPLSTIRDHTRAPSPQATLDAVDVRLLMLLSTDGRISQRSMARELGMSPPAVADRLARLEKRGVISGYAVRLDWSAIGYPTIVYLTVTAMHGYAQGPVMEQLAALREVEEVMLVTGGIDLLVRVRVRDHTHLRDLLINDVWRIEGIQRTETSLTIAEMEPKNSARDLLSDLLERLEPADAPTALSQSGSTPG
jgi:Lrp/AsnC family leucine-responsive transcriptional regulator